MHYLDNTLGNPPAMHYGNHVEDAQYEHRTKGSNIRTRTINGMLFVWLLSAIGLAVVMNVMLMQIMRLSLSSGEWSAATTTTTTTTVMNVSYRRMSTSETLDTSPEWRHVDVDKPYGRYRIWMPSSLTRQPTTAPAIVIADVHKGDFYIERLANNKKNDSAYTVPFVLQPPAEHDISINNNTVIDSFIVRIESSKSITGASVRLISPGVYHVNYTLGRWMDIVRHRLTVRVEYVDYPLDALTMANEVRDRRQLKVPRFKKVRELYSAPDADLLLDIDLDIPAASSIASTSASLLPPCTSSYAQPSQWVAFNTTKHCIANDPIGYSTDTYSHSPFDCTTRWLCFSEAHQCLTQRHRRIVLIGDSYVRETYTDMAKLLTGAKQVWNDTEKQKDAMVEWKGKEGAQTTTTLEYYFAGRLDMLQRRFASGSRRLPSQRWWCLPGMPDVVLFDHGMWSIYMESLESYRSGMYTFTRGFLTAMLADRRAQCPTVPLPHLLFLTMPSTTLHEGLRSRARIDLWNRAAIDAIHDVIVELRRLHSEPLLHIDILDYFAPTDLRPERSDGNHFGDWMQGVAVPVLSKANVNALLNRVCYS